MSLKSVFTEADSQNFSNLTETSSSIKQKFEQELTLDKNDNGLSICEIHEQLKKELEFVKLENIMLENFLRNVNCSEFHLSNYITNSQEFNLISSGSRTQISKTNIETPENWKYNIKNEIAMWFYLDTENKCSQIEKQTKEEISQLKIKIIRLRLTIVEIDKFLKSFKNVFLVSGSDANKEIMSEKFLNFIRNWIKNGSSIVKNLRLQASSLKRKRLAKKSYLKRKSKLQETLLAPVDFDLLHLKITKFNRILITKNSYLIDLKSRAGKSYVQILKEKESLDMIQKSIEILNKKIMKTTKNLRKLQIRIKMMEKIISICGDKIMELQEKHEMYTAPTIQDYMNVKDLLKSLKQEEKLINHRNYMLQLQLKNAKTKIKKNILK